RAAPALLDAGLREPPRGYNPATDETSREVAATDIIFLVERLEALAASAKKLPLTNNVVLDQAAILELIDQLRVAVPPEVAQARRVTEKATRLNAPHSREGAAGTPPHPR